MIIVKRLKKMFTTSVKKMDFEFFFDYIAETSDLFATNFQHPDWRPTIWIYIFMIPALCFYGGGFYAMISAESIGDFLKATWPFFTSFLNLPKSFVIIIFYNKLRKLVNEIRATNNADTINNKYLKKYMWIANVVTRTFIINYTATAIILVLVHLYGFTNYKLALSIKIPGVRYRIETLAGYFAHALVIFGTILYNAPSLLIADLCFIYFTLYIGYRLEICEHLFTSIGDTQDEKKEDELLLDMIKLHGDTVRFLEECNSVYSAVTFLQYIGQMVLITTTMFGLFLEPWAISNYVLLGVLLFLMFMYCFFGQMIFTKTTNLPIIVYDSNWYTLTSTRHRKMILFLLMNCQRTTIFQSYGLCEYSYRAFAQVMRATYGYYTFLKNLL